MKAKVFLFVVMSLLLIGAASAQTDTVTVTFLINTATVPDTMSANSNVQLRGDTSPLTWDNLSGINAVNIGGDYWRATGKFAVTRGTPKTINYKFFTNVKSGALTASDGGWESNTTNSGGNRQMTLGTTAGNKDTTMSLQYVNCTSSAKTQFWTPYTPSTDSVAVLIRVNMQSDEGFNKSTMKLGVRGGTAPLDWGRSIFLTRETSHGNAGQDPYDGTNFWSAWVKFPKTTAAGNIEYKFVIHQTADAPDASPTWENTPNRIIPFNPAMPDTTMGWKWWQDTPMGNFSGTDNVIITYRADLAEAISENGFAYGDTLVVRSGYNSSAAAIREKRMLRVGASSKYQAIDTVTTKLTTPLYYQYYRVPSSGEVREIYYNFANPGASATAEKRRYMMSSLGLTIRDTVASTSDEHRMPRFRNMKFLAQPVLVTYTCDIRPAIYQLKRGDSLVATNITAYTIKDPDSVLIYGVWMNGPAVGGWDIGGAWGADRRALDSCKMYDDGTHGDLVAHDSIFSLQKQYQTTTTVGQEFKFGIYGCDNEGGFGNNHIENINDANPTATIESQFGSIDPVFYSAWNYTEKRPSTTAINAAGQTPLSYRLDQNYPNPFNPSTTINYELKETGIVTIKVFNVLGQLVSTLIDGKQTAGFHTVTFDASQLSTGLYFYHITAGSFSSTKKMLLVK